LKSFIFIFREDIGPAGILIFPFNSIQSNDLSLIRCLTVYRLHLGVLAKDPNCIMHTKA